jgi:voltage-gated potassium channel
MADRPPASGAGRALTGISLAVLLLAIVFIGGTAGYVIIGGWSLWDAFYMTVITVTTVAYREVHAMSRAGELFTSALLLVGVGTALYTFTLAATVVVEGGLQAHLARRRVTRMIDQLEHHSIPHLRPS